MDPNIEKRIMNDKSIESNAKKALGQYKLEIGSELNTFSTNETPSGLPTDNLLVGGTATRKLVEIAERKLAEKFNKK